MSAMSEIATELELFWQRAEVGCYWRRTLPNGDQITISTWSIGIGETARSGYRLTTNRQEVWSGSTLAEAVVAAGQIARAQLEAKAMTWS